MRTDPGRFRDKEIETIRLCKVNELTSRVMWVGTKKIDVEVPNKEA